MREYLVEFRKKKGLSQKDISSLLGISESYYNLIEKGTRKKDMSIGMLFNLSQIFEVSLMNLINQEIDFKSGVNKE